MEHLDLARALIEDSNLLFAFPNRLFVLKTFKDFFSFINTKTPVKKKEEC